MKNIFYGISFVLVFIVGSNATATPLGRLFTTPAERVYLDKIRNNYKFGQTIFEEADRQRPIKLENKSIVFNGVMRRGNGKKEVWVDGQKIAGVKGINKSASSDNNILVKQGNRRHYISVKPGQIVDSNNGRVVESYQSLTQPSEHPSGAVKIK